MNYTKNTINVIYLIVNHIEISIIDVIKYLPVSAMYISSMVIGYKGLKFIKELICCDILLCNISGQLVKDNKN